ncbi:NADP-binding protein [Candidatus Pacearchaeota archaeon]|nr:NADP-binding protein [Candidatus Pacearchaeota archaeon]
MVLYKKMGKIRVIQFGLGAMGSMMAKIMLEKKDLQIVGAIDRKPENQGKDLGVVLGLKRNVGVKVSDNADEVFRTSKADIMLHAAVSYVPKVWEQIQGAVKQGISVITIAEEMGYPFPKYPALCNEIDATAKKYDVSVLGSGINPGFAMDLMPLFLTGICQNVKEIKVTRVIDFSPFGPAIQKNIGIGMDVSEFKQGVKEGKLPLHIGLPESLSMLAHGLHWDIDKIIETRDPVAAKKPITVPGYMKIKKGNVAGFDHRCFGMKNGKKVITLEELGRVDPKEEYYNRIIIEGIPRLVETINVPPGNITTTSHAVNLIPVVLNAKPGLLSMLNLPVAPALSQ